ncbi:MAG TPA: iron-siderophore ABC transporter substrate-binding protein [Acidimicrobiales bacterium]|nr:iron-siderophore ABC transporter substrate-binding protein [Acidimicrobiales bacterium]
MTRRATSTRALLLSAALLLPVLAGCGSSDSGSSDSGAKDETTTTFVSKAEDGAFPVTVEHALGETTIEEEPQRIVSVGYTEQDTLLALGVIPVGVTDWYGDQPDATWPWAHDLLDGAHPEVLTNTDSIDYESVAALEPDLILGLNAGLDENSYQKLSAIAPTVAQVKGANPWFSEWKPMTELIGEAIGQPQAAKDLVADVEQQFADAAEANPEFAGKDAIFLQNAFYDGEAIAYQKGLSTDFLTDLGFDVPAELDQYVTEEGGQAYIPMENLGVLDTADVLIWGTEKPEDRTALEEEPLFNALDAVKEDRLVYTDGTTAGAIYFSSPLSLPYVLEQLVPALKATIAGDGPSTTGEA